MAQPLDAQQASVEITGYIRAILGPSPGEATLGDILGAYIFKARLREAGFAIMPILPTADMKKAFKSGWFKSFKARYEELVQAGWPDAPTPPHWGNVDLKIGQGGDERDGV